MFNIEYYRILLSINDLSYTSGASSRIVIFWVQFYDCMTFAPYQIAPLQKSTFQMCLISDSRPVDLRPSVSVSPPPPPYNKV